MKTLRELTDTLRLRPQEINSSVKHFMTQPIDWDVYLPTRGINLQRDFVWNIHQKREIIWSILLRRNIPRFAVIYTMKNVYEIIDGKQRLSSIFDFVDNKFTLSVEGSEYYFNQLPDEYQKSIQHYYLAYYVVNETSQFTITDEDKITWFRFINFSGTKQDVAHMASLAVTINSK